MVTLPKTPSFRLDGRKALVTGAGRGIGLACAAALGEAGADLVLVARTLEEVEAVAEAINAAGGTARAKALDITDIAAAEAFVAEEGPFQVLVNNAGTNRPKRLVDVTQEDYDLVVDLNVKATLFLTRAVAKGLIAAGLPGSIITMSSQMGHVGGDRRTVYCASKHAVEGFTKALAWELGPHNIRVNTICPTFIATEMTKSTLADPAQLALIKAKIALPRLGETHDLMGAVVYLAADASALVTGSALMVDGGWTAV